MRMQHSQNTVRWGLSPVELFSGRELLGVAEDATFHFAPPDTAQVPNNTEMGRDLPRKGFKSATAPDKT